eukprot:7382268-Prymnesium_polylepis.2
MVHSMGFRQEHFGFMLRHFELCGSALDAPQCEVDLEGLAKCIQAIHVATRADAIVSKTVQHRDTRPSWGLTRLCKCDHAGHVITKRASELVVSQTATISTRSITVQLSVVMGRCTAVSPDCNRQGGGKVWNWTIAAASLVLDCIGVGGVWGRVEEKRLLDGRQGGADGNRLCNRLAALGKQLVPAQIDLDRRRSVQCCEHLRQGGADAHGISNCFDPLCIVCSHQVPISPILQVDTAERIIGEVDL